MISTTWAIPLYEPPEVVAIGRNAHGFRPSDRYCLPDLWAVHLYGYTADLSIGEVELEIRPGFAGVIPPGKMVEYRYRGISVHLYAHFRLPSSDAFGTRIPAMQDLGVRYEDAFTRLYEMVGRFPQEPARVNARLWDFLWDLTKAPSDDPPHQAMHRAVKIATELVDRKLGDPISVEMLAVEAGVSYSYLARLFQESFGTTVISYIRLKRLEHAAHLLERSTLPIKAIANSVGIPDLQHFNKAVKARYGMSPRRLRETYLDNSREKRMLNQTVEHFDSNTTLLRPLSNGDKPNSRYPD